MRTEVIKADTIDAAVERILNELRRDTSSSSRENAIYFDGWDGLGASAVLQAVADRLAISDEQATRPTGLKFEKIIHIDCSKWESRRAMQREIAEQLKLPKWVMEMFDKQDEEDDFDGLDQGSRGEIAQVVIDINQTIQNRRFLVILHNGSNEEINIFNFGLSLPGYYNSKMLWTFQGRFRLDPKMTGNVKKNTTDVFLSASADKRDPEELWSYLVRHEAAHVSCSNHGHGIIDPEIVAKCVLYLLKKCCIGSHIVDYDWGIHTSNYWICDGIIAPTDNDKAWQVGGVLQRELRLLGIDDRLNSDESTVVPSSHLARAAEHTPYWISTATCEIVLSPSGAIPQDMFRHSHRLGVLKLSRCTFSFSSPPFLCCHSLRFLWIDRCQDLLTRRSTTDHHHTDADKDEEELDNSTTTSWECFQSLWVLDLRYTDWDQILSARVMDLMTQLRELNVMGAKNWDMSHLRGRVRNIRKLRVTKSTCCFNNNVFSEMESMEVLDFSGNRITQGMTSLSGPARSRSLKTVVIDGGEYGLKKISLRGCKELKNLLLKGAFWRLEELDLSGTTVQTLDLTQMVASRINRLILLGCEKLRAILWPEKAITKWLDVLLIDTTSTSASAPHAHPHGDRSLQKQKEEKFKDWRISLTDARLLRSFSPIIAADSKILSSVHIDICAAATLGSNELVQVQPHTSTYKDISEDGPVAALITWDCPEISVAESWQRRSRTCIIKVMMHGQGNKLSEDARSASTSALLLPDRICRRATSLHVYDNSSITSIPPPPQGSQWNILRWCRVERCPKLYTLFTGHLYGSSFHNLQTFWASQLLTARYIWNWSIIFIFSVHLESFEFLNFLHVDYCPRLIHIIPMHIDDMLPFCKLETLEIVYCCDLRGFFPLDPDERQQQDIIIEFPNLKRIHLHELPTLEHIYGRRMSAPNLETIKIRGCWSLRRLPAIGRDTMPPKVDCEKEWWDGLEWDGVEANHHPSLYQPSHSRYYKAQLPRGSLLR